MSEHQPATKRKGIRKFGFALSLLLVVVGTLVNIIQISIMPTWQLPTNMTPYFLSTIILITAVITGLPALLAESIDRLAKQAKTAQQTYIENRYIPNTKQRIKYQDTIYSLPGPFGLSEE